MKVDLGAIRGLDAHRQALAGLVAHLQEIEAQADGQAMTAEQMGDFEETVGSRLEIEKVIEQLLIRQSAIAEAVSAGQVEEVGQAVFPTFNVRKAPENVYDLSAYRQRASSVDELPALYRDGAMRVIDQASFPTVKDQSKARDEVGQLLAKHRDTGYVARRIIGTDNPQYRDAWAEYIAKGGTNALSPTRLAVLQTYSDTDGGFAIPFTLDPTFINTSDGSVNPLRAISRVETITTKSWQGVTTAGVSAAYVSEATRATTGASDSAPTDLDNPTATPVSADVAVDVSAEFLEDYGTASLSSEVGNLIQIAKDDLEATKFVLGDGSDEPEGIVYALITDTTSIVETATNSTFVLADIDTLIGATPPRFRSRGRFLANLAILQLIPAFGSAGQPGNSIYDQLSGRLRGYPVHEASAMDDVTTDNKEVLLFGDFKAGFIIVDRVGLSTRVLDRFDGSGRPTGGRVIYARWRNTSKLLFPNAFRLLRINPV